MTAWRPSDDLAIVKQLLVFLVFGPGFALFWVDPGHQSKFGPDIGPRRSDLERDLRRAPARGGAAPVRPEPVKKRSERAARLRLELSQRRAHPLRSVEDEMVSGPVSATSQSSATEPDGFLIAGQTAAGFGVAGGGVFFLHRRFRFGLGNGFGRRRLHIYRRQPLKPAGAKTLCPEAFGVFDRHLQKWRLHLRARPGPAS